MKKIYLVSALILVLLLATGISGCKTKSKKVTVPDGGIFISTDFAENWTQHIKIENSQDAATIGAVNMQSLYFDPMEPTTIYLTTKGNGIYKSSNSGVSWQTTSLRVGTYVGLGIDPRSPGVMYATQGNKIQKTVDGMKTWHELYTETRPGQTLVSVLVDQNNSNIIYAAATTSILKSTDYGNEWVPLGWEKLKIYQLFLSSKDSNTLYAQTNRGLYKSINGGVDWADINAGLATYKGALTIYTMYVDPITEHIFMSTAAGLLKSTDGGLSWSSVPTLFDGKKVAIRTLLFNPNNHDWVVFSVRNVVHKTEDGGKTWKTLKTVKTARTISYITADPEIPDRLYLGTYLAPKK